MTFSFANDYIFGLLLPVLFLAWRWIAGEKRNLAPVRAASSELWSRVLPSMRVRFRWIPKALRVIALICVVLALARPQAGRTYQVNEGEGIDIILALDVSGSMAAQDFAPKDRLFVAKRTIEKFIEGRKVDRIGLVLFARKAFTQAPLTLDYGIIRKFLEQAQIGMIEDGTAVGMALVTAANRLKDSTAASKVVVLLTDGDNNSGQVDPGTAADLAAAIDVRVHTVGIGSDGPVYLPVKHPVLGERLVKQNLPLDEKTLKNIAEKTGGEYFRAKDAGSLEKIFDSIDKMERSPYEIKTFTDFTEKYHLFLGAAFALILLEILLSRTIFRRVF